MAKVTKTNLSSVMLALFVFLAPAFGSGMEKTAVIFASLCAFLAAIIYDVYKNGSIIITKTGIACFVAAVYAFVQIMWVSDKGSQFEFASLLLLAALAALAAARYKRQSGKEKWNLTLQKTAYTTAIACAVLAVLYQIFIESSFLGCNMDFGNGSATGTAILMLVGIMAGLKLFQNKKKEPGVITGLVVMAYVFVMTKSLPGYLLASVIVFVTYMRKAKKRSEALFSLLAVIFFSAANVIFYVAEIIGNREQLNAAFAGIVSVIGVGSGGYNARAAVIDRGYAGFANTVNFMCESMGIVGIVLVGAAIWGAVMYYKKRPTVINLTAMATVLVLTFVSSAALVYMLPFAAMFYAAREDGREIKAGRVLCATLIVPAAFFMWLVAAHIPYAMGRSALDGANYSDAAELYAVGAKMEMFNSNSWEKAYGAAYKASEKGLQNASVQREYLEKAIKFNDKNYKYRILLADAYSAEGDYISALEVWDGIIERHDKEYLYPMYAQKMCDVMASCPIGLEKMEEIFQRLTLYAQKTQDKDIKLEVNNILSKSQQYYISAREGDLNTADMY